MAKDVKETTKKNPLGIPIDPALAETLPALAAYHAKLEADRTETESGLRVIEHLGRGYPIDTIERARNDFCALAKEKGYRGEKIDLYRAFSVYCDWLRYRRT